MILLGGGFNGRGDFMGGSFLVMIVVEDMGQRYGLFNLVV